MRVRATSYCLFSPLAQVSIALFPLQYPVAVSLLFSCRGWNYVCLLPPLPVPRHAAIFAHALVALGLDIENTPENLLVGGLFYVSP